MDTQIDPAKAQKKDPTVTPKKMLHTLQNPSENAILDAQNIENVIKPLKKWREIPPRGPEAPKWLQIKFCFKTTVKVPVAGTLCTRVRTRSVFRKRFPKKRFWAVTVCKKRHQWCTIGTLSRDLQCVLKVLQNRSESVKKAFRSTQCWLWVVFCNGFRNVHTKSPIEVQTFGLDDAETRSTRENTWSGEHLCARPEGEHDLEPKALQMRARTGDTH